MHGNKIINQNSTHFLTMTVVGWIDIFTREDYRIVITDSLNYCRENKGLIINAYVLMSNHIHLICYTKEPIKLSDTIRDLKNIHPRK